MDSNPFDDRRAANPQGVIDDLLKLITNQAVEIRTRGAEIERLGVLLKEAGIDPSKPPEPKKRGGRKKKDTIPDVVLNGLGSVGENETACEPTPSSELCDVACISDDS